MLAYNMPFVMSPRANMSYLFILLLSPQAKIHQTGLYLPRTLELFDAPFLFMTHLQHTGERPKSIKTKWIFY